MIAHPMLWNFIRELISEANPRGSAAAFTHFGRIIASLLLGPDNTRDGLSSIC
jgi:hypothetical protein